MRVSALLAAALVGAVAAPAAAQMVMPTRKPGYWDQTMVMPGPQGTTMKSQFCTDAAVEKSISVFGQQTAQASCSKNNVRRTPTGFAFESTCTFGKSTTTTVGTATGDFSKAYTVSMVTKSNPPLAPGMAETKMSIQAKWLGACPTGRKPGDMVMPGGMVVNMAKMGRPGR